MNENILFELEDNPIEYIEFYKDKDSFLDEKDRTRVIKNIETIIRSSIEYKNIMSYIKNTSEMNICSILEGISSNEAKLEIHHNCLTLFDYVDIIIRYFDYNRIKWTTYMVASEVMKIHYQNNISLIPLTTTIHQYVHSKNIIFNKSNCIGNIENFYEQYKDYFNEEQIEKYTTYINTIVNISNIISQITEK